MRSSAVQILILNQQLIAQFFLALLSEPSFLFLCSIKRQGKAKVGVGDWGVCLFARKLYHGRFYITKSSKSP